MIGAFGASTNGIKQLMQAEKKAGQVVAAARKERSERLKRARNEAMKEIEIFRYALDSECRSDCT